MKPEEKNPSSFTLPRAAMFLGAKSASLSYKALTLKKNSFVYVFVCVFSRVCKCSDMGKSEVNFSIVPRLSHWPETH